MQAATITLAGDDILLYVRKIVQGHTIIDPYEFTSMLNVSWQQDPLGTLRLIFYLRAIDRNSEGPYKHTELQEGLGRKHEFILALKWLQKMHYSVNADSLWMVPCIGSWKDLWYDSANTGLYHYSDTSIVYPLVRSSILENHMNVHLLAKYLPKIRSRSNIKNKRHIRLNTWARGLISYLEWDELQYRRFKTAANINNFIPTNTCLSISESGKIRTFEEIKYLPFLRDLKA